MTSLCALVVGCPPDSRKKIEALLKPHGFDCVMLERAAEALEYSRDIIALLVICMEEGRASGLELEALVRDGYFGADPPPVIRLSHSSG
jgi:CheY-like chemotaxis protein